MVFQFSSCTFEMNQEINIYHAEEIPNESSKPLPSKKQSYHEMISRYFTKDLEPRFFSRWVKNLRHIS